MGKRKIIMICLGIINIGLLFTALYIKNTTVVKMNPQNVTIISAPEQEEPMEHKDFVKEVYVPEVPKGENVALGKKVKANGFQDVYTPRKVVDGKSEGVSYWEGKSDSYPNIITVDLGKSIDIHTIRLCINPDTLWGERTQTFSVECSEDGKEFLEVMPSMEYIFNPNTGNQVTIPLENKKTRFIQLTFTQNTGAKGAQLAEFEVYH